MRKIAAGLISCIIMTALIGCKDVDGKPDEQNIEQSLSGHETEMDQDTMEFCDLADGMSIDMELTDGVTINAVVELPERGMEDINICHVTNKFFDGKAILANLYPDISESECQEYDYSDIGVPSALVYSGLIPVGDEKINGGFALGATINVFTSSWSKKSYNFPYSFQSEESFLNQEVPGLDMEESIDTAYTLLTDILDIDDIRFYKLYGYSYEYLQEQEDISQTLIIEENVPYEKNGDRGPQIYTEEDNCYEIYFEQYTDGIPVICEPVTNRDETSIFLECKVGLSSKGIESVSVLWNPEVMDKEKTSLLEFDEIIDVLKNKFDLILDSNAEIFKIRLVYYPYPVNAREFLYDFIPAWEFTYRQGERTGKLYINAVTGEEIV